MQIYGLFCEYHHHIMQSLWAILLASRMHSFMQNLGLFRCFGIVQNSRVVLQMSGICGHIHRLDLLQFIELSYPSMVRHIISLALFLLPLVVTRSLLITWYCLTPKPPNHWGLIGIDACA